MDLDTRRYLKKIRETKSLVQLEKEFSKAIEEGRKFGSDRYDKSPLLQWYANKRITRTIKLNEAQ